MTIELPDSEIGNLRLTPEQARLDLAVGMYSGREVSLGRGARIAGLPKVLFLREIGKRGIGLHYSMEDLLHDIEMAEELSRKPAAT